MMLEQGHGNDVSRLKKGSWNRGEEEILKSYVERHGDGHWNNLRKSGLLRRIGKSCCLRWANHLRPDPKKGPFSPEEERRIIALHAELGNKWSRIAALILEMMPEQGHGNDGSRLKKGSWNRGEDEIQKSYVERHGDGHWNNLRKSGLLRITGKSCRLRWANHLRPDPKKGPFSPGEERRIIALHAELGNKWSCIAALGGYVESRFFACVSVTHLAWENSAILNICMFHQEFMNLVNSLVAHGGNRMPCASPSS